MCRYHPCSAEDARSDSAGPMEPDKPLCKQISLCVFVPWHILRERFTGDVDRSLQGLPYRLRRYKRPLVATGNERQHTCAQICPNGRRRDAWHPAGNCVTTVLDPVIHISRQKQNGRYFAVDIFNLMSLNENWCISMQIPLKFFKVPIGNMPTLIQIMVWCRSGDKPLSDKWWLSIPTHTCITGIQWVNEDSRSALTQNHSIQLITMKYCTHHDTVLQGWF